MTEQCEHDKIYAWFSYLTNPPQVPWICRKCDAQGVDVFGKYKEEDYNKLVRRFEMDRV